MALEVGSRLGPYNVTAEIGEGGMGKVYRARDTKLDRDVALKILPQAFTGDPDRLARCEREAEVLASLNHPNIEHILRVSQPSVRQPSHTGDNRRRVLSYSSASPVGIDLGRLHAFPVSVARPPL